MTDRDKSRRGYHHGNLREALIDAARRLIGEHGPSGFTFSDAAKAAGVSPAAPYRHFKDRDALLAEVAAQGFEQFADRLEAAFQTGGPSPLGALEAVMEAYLSFARSEPAFFAAMFQSGVPGAPNGGAAGERAFAILRLACEGVIRHLPEAKRPPVHMMTYHIWALGHGIAELFGMHGAGLRAPIEAAELLEAGVAVYLRGLGIIPSDL